jgi:hypothetical protein
MYSPTSFWFFVPSSASGVLFRALCHETKHCVTRLLIQLNCWWHNQLLVQTFLLFWKLSVLFRAMCHEITGSIKLRMTQPTSGSYSLLFGCFFQSSVSRDYWFVPTSSSGGVSIRALCVLFYFILIPFNCWYPFSLTRSQSQWNCWCPLTWDSYYSKVFYSI